jgi:acyl dehydratase
MGVNYGLDGARFPTPVKVGSRVRARTTMIDVDAVGERAVKVVNRFTIEVEGEEEPACVTDLVGRYHFR